MTKVTIDTIPKKYVEYLQTLPQGSHHSVQELSHTLYSSPITRPMIASEVEDLLGNISGQQCFALFEEPPAIEGVTAYSQSIIPGLQSVDLLELIEKLQLPKDHEEEKALLYQFFTHLSLLEGLYAEIIALIARMKKG